MVGVLIKNFAYLTQLFCFHLKEFMDDDLRAALFDGFDEDGEFEELNDDFIAEASILLKYYYCFLNIIFVGFERS